MRSQQYDLPHPKCSFELSRLNEPMPNICTACALGPCVFHEVSDEYEDAKPLIFPPKDGRVFLTRSPQ